MTTSNKLPDLIYKEYPILYVDDEHANRVVMKHALGDEFTLFVADSAEEALEVLAKEFVAVLLTDQRMPKASGVDLAERVFLLYPEIVRVIITAYSDVNVTIDAINRAQVHRFIKKPWSPDDLMRVVRESIQCFRTTRAVKELQAQMLQNEREVALDLLSSSLAHDLRSPLNIIEPNLETIQRDLDALLFGNLQQTEGHRKLFQMRETLEDIIFGIKKLQTLVDRLLKPQKCQHELRVVDLRELVCHAITVTRGAIVRIARLEILLPEEPIYIKATEGRIMQLVTNLLFKAAQALDEKKYATNYIWVRLKAVDQKAVIEFEDTGEGMSPEQIENIFTPFLTTQQDLGSELGLTICRQIVDAFDGSIHLRSQPSQGSCFVVTFPLAEN